MNEITSNIVNFPELSKNAQFEIMPCDLTSITPGKYTSFQTSKLEKSQLGLLQSQLINVVDTAALANAYIVKFPEGLPHTLMHLSQGGVSSTIVNTSGRIAGTASLFDVQSLAAASACFSLMSFATGQYYLQNIHNDLNMINLKIDQILGFLYGEKSAELLAEISFVNDAYMNYSSIMKHDNQKLSILSGLQNSKKIAMKDIEFYINDLSKTVQSDTKNYTVFEKVVSDSMKIKDSLTMATQLLTMANVLEVYYSENYDQAYIDNVKRSITGYIDKCDNRILAEFSRLTGRNSEYTNIFGKKLDTSKLGAVLDEVVNSYSTTKDSDHRSSLINALDSINTPVEYLITADGEIAYRAVND